MTGITSLTGFLVAASLFVSASSVSAGVADSPLPVFSGGPAQHVFSVPGAIKNNNVETEFICTSLASDPITIGVETFRSSGGTPLNDVNPPTLNGAGTVQPGETITIGTANTAGIHEDKVINLKKCFAGGSPGALCNINGDCGVGTCTGLRCIGGSTPGAVCVVDGDCGGGTCSPPLRNGSARIVSDSKNITCSAFLVDTISSPPASMVSLKVIPRKKQKGD